MLMYELEKTKDRTNKQRNRNPVSLVQVAQVIMETWIEHEIVKRLTIHFEDE